MFVGVELDQAANFRLFPRHVAVEFAYQRADERRGGWQFVLGRHGLFFQSNLGGTTVGVEPFQSGEGTDRLNGASQRLLGVFNNTRAALKHIHR